MVTNSSPTTYNQRWEQLIGMGALLLLLIGGFTILKPFMTAIMWSVILGFSLWPAQRLLTKLLRGRRTLAAVVVAISVATLLVGPIVLLGVGLADDATVLGTTTKKWIESSTSQPPSWLKKVPLVGERVETYWVDFSQDRKRWLEQIDKGMKDVPLKDKPVDEDGDIILGGEASAADAIADELNKPLAVNPVSPEEKLLDDERIFELLGKTLGWARSWLVGATFGVVMGVLQIVMSILLTFFILRDGEALGARVAVAASRIAGVRGQHLIKVAGNTVRGVVYGIIGTAVAQGVLAGLGLGLAGVPAAALLGVLTFFLSAVPVGPPLVWIPATIWLFSTGNTGWAVFMLLWGIFVVSGVDNIIKPYLISHGAKIPFVIVFMGVIGGALAFGLVGVFLGPTLLAVAYRILEEWSSAQALLETPSPTSSDSLASQVGSSAL